MSNSTNRTLSYWDDLRDPQIIQDVIISNSSAVIQVEDIRMAHILSIMPSTQISANGVKTAATSNIYIEAAGFLAMHHFNQRSGQVLPYLPERLANCNLYLTINMTDSSFSPIQASRHLYASMILEHTLSTPKPVAILGDYRSSSSLPLSMLSGSYNIPHMNCASTSSSLDNKYQSPTFMRTVPTNAVDAHAIILYMSQHLRITRMGLLFVRDAYGTQFSKDLSISAAKYNLSIKVIPYEGGDADSIRSAMVSLKDSGVRYVFGIISAATSSFKMIVTEARNFGIMGNSEYSWHFGDGFSSMLSPSFYETTLLPTVQEDRYVAEALSGSGVILLSPPPHHSFEKAMADLGNNQELLDYYKSRHDNQTTFQGFDFQAKPSLYQYTNYDAIMSLGIALCDSQEDFITSEQMLQQVKSSQFEGVSGHVSFDPNTGTRTSDGLAFNVMNLVIEVNDGENPSFELDVRVAATIWVDSDNVTTLSPFVFAGGSVVPPLELPPLEENMNLLPIGILIFMWIMAIAVILTSIGFAAWTYRYRQKYVVRSSQPFFLLMLCCGTFLMATCIIPMSLQEPIPQSGLDIACMATPWLFVMGFGSATSSLLCKSLRINHLFHHSKNLRRKRVTVRDVIYPFFLLTSINVILLICWTVIAPARWIRSDLMNIDRYGRSVESIGHCGYNETDAHVSFVVTLLLVNFVYTIIGNYQCYRTRMMPANFNETSYIGMSMASILESLLIGVPIIFVSKDSPKVDLVVRSILVTLLSFAILLPLFTSKLRMLKMEPKSRNQSVAAWTAAMQRSSDARPGRASGGCGRRQSGIDFKAAALVAVATNQNSIENIRSRVAMSNDSSRNTGSVNLEQGDFNDSLPSGALSGNSNFDGNSRAGGMGISWNQELITLEETSSSRVSEQVRRGGDSIAEIRARAAMVKGDRMNSRLEAERSVMFDTSSQSTL